MVKTQENTTEIRWAAQEFYSALQAIFKGDTTPMEQVWSHADDVTYLGPQGGILEGWDQVLEAWKEQAALKLGGNIEPHEMHVLQYGDIGYTQNYEIGSNIVNNTPQNVRIRAINIFRKENGKWKMVTHQTDILSFLVIQ